MDESILELENELKRLRPRAPSAELLAGIERELARCDRMTAHGEPRYTTATTLRSWKWVTWSVAGAAAVLALAFTFHSMLDRSDVPEAAAVATSVYPPVSARESTAALATTDRYEPVQATSVLYALQESPPTTLPDRSRGREVRYRFVDTYEWKNPARNASVRWSVPRDEVRLVRANLD